MLRIYTRVSVFKPIVPLLVPLNMKGEFMRERDIEKALTKEVKKRGGLELKFVSPGMAGVPDRLLLMKYGKIAFVELKAPRKEMKPLQILRKRQLESLGFLVYCIDSKEKIGGVLDEICTS